MLMKKILQNIIIVLMIIGICIGIGIAIFNQANETKTGNKFYNIFSRFEKIL